MSDGQTHGERLERNEAVRNDAVGGGSRMVVVVRREGGGLVEADLGVPEDELLAAIVEAVDRNARPEVRHLYPHSVIGRAAAAIRAARRSS